MHKCTSSTHEITSFRESGKLSIVKWPNVEPLAVCSQLAE